MQYDASVCIASVVHFGYPFLPVYLYMVPQWKGASFA